LTILGDQYCDRGVAEIGPPQPAGNELFQFGDREALHRQLNEKGIAEPVGVTEPHIHAEIFLAKNLDASLLDCDRYQTLGFGE
jgi:hypothetical protein